MDIQPKPNTVCPLCGGANQCAPAQCGSFDTPCWCRTAHIDPAILARIPAAQRGEACICPRCAAAGLPAAAGD
ncbi:cysteine-rich CWC family protein [Chitinimonas naiadis]